jgi:hypothetical protein
VVQHDAFKDSRRTEVAFESPEWREDNTFRGMPSFGIRVYERMRDYQMESEILGDL